jgi:predicted transcriptional regulator YheO
MVLIINRTVIEGGEAENPRENLFDLVNKLEAEGLDPRAALRKAAKLLGLSRDEAYRRLNAEKRLRT